jgi:hypothetical protein
MIAGALPTMPEWCGGDIGAFTIVLIILVLYEKESAIAIWKRVVV